MRVGERCARATRVRGRAMARAAPSSPECPVLPPVAVTGLGCLPHQGRFVPKPSIISDTPPECAQSSTATGSACP